MAIRPMRWVGGISYSLYLWHWPLLVLPAAAIAAPLPWPARAALVGLTFVLAEASRRWIEDPIRHGSVARLPPSRTLATAGALSLVVAGVSLGAGRAVETPVLATVGSRVSGPVVLELPTPLPATTPGATSAPSASGTPSTTPRAAPTIAATPAGPVPADLVPPLATVRDDAPVIYADTCHAEWRETQPHDCVYGRKDLSTTVVLIGDSHAAHWFPTFERLADERDWRLISLTKSACPVADVPVYNASLKREYTECADWRAAVLQRIEKERPALVAISDSRSGELLVDGKIVASTDREDVWAAGLRRSIEAIERSAQHVLVIGDTPNPSGDPPVCLSDHLDDALACATPRSKALGPKRTATERTVSAETGATFIDPSPWLCPSEPCPAIIGRVLVYRDGHHMTTPFAAALAPYLEPLLPTLPS